MTNKEDYVLDEMRELKSYISILEKRLGVDNKKHYFHSEENCPYKIKLERLGVLNE